MVTPMMITSTATIGIVIGYQNSLSIITTDVDNDITCDIHIQKLGSADVGSCIGAAKAGCQLHASNNVARIIALILLILYGSRAQKDAMSLPGSSLVVEWAIELQGQECRQHL